ncbi:hypothetical protein [Novimethylophilus sp.]|uniref:hypothetical protein n=1 Tax=Novimethylophilus sp. TaxID=2137426 RepID=UPI002F3ECF7D
MEGCAADPASLKNGARQQHAPDDILTPWRIIKGGRLAARQDPNGFPLPDSLKGFTPLIYPAALAAHAPDLYIADAGAGRIYRYYADLQALNVVPGVAATTRTRLQMAADWSLLVLDPARSSIVRLSRGGQALQTIVSPLTSAHLTEFVVGEYLDKIYVTDQLNQQLMLLHPLGPAGTPLITAGEGEFKALGALATAGSMVYAVDAGCSCIAAIDEGGRILAHIGQGELIQPSALVADQFGRLYVADGFDRTLKVFRQRKLIARYAPNKLQVIEITALAIDQGALYIADGPGAQVVIFRIRPPGNEPQ